MQTERGRLPSLAARGVVAFAIALACSRREAPVACSLIGCVNTLVLEVQNAPPGPITVRATPVGSADTARTIVCAGETGCTNVVAFPAGFAPARVQLTVTTTAGTRDWDVTPMYDTSRSNGPKCGEVCRFGTVHIAWR